MDVGIYLDGRNPPQWARPWPEHYARTLELVRKRSGSAPRRCGSPSTTSSRTAISRSRSRSPPRSRPARAPIRIGTAVLLARAARPRAARRGSRDGRHPQQRPPRPRRRPRLSRAGVRGLRPHRSTAGSRRPKPCLREVLRLWDDRRRHPRCPCSSRCRCGAGSSGHAARASTGELGAGLLAFDRRAHGRRTAPGWPRAATTPSRPASRRCATSCSPTTPKRCGRSSGPTSRTSGTRTTGTRSKAPARPTPRPIDPDRWRAPGQGRRAAPLRRVHARSGRGAHPRDHRRAPRGAGVPVGEHRRACPTSSSTATWISRARSYATVSL